MSEQFPEHRAEDAELMEQDEVLEALKKFLDYGWIDQEAFEDRAWAYRKGLQE